MPLLTPTQDENRAEFISRCMSDETMQNEYPDQEQRLAVCGTQFDQGERSMSQNDRLLKNIQSRQQKRTEFGYGIITADKYVRTMQECVGLETCYHLMSHGKISFDDVMRKASGTLVYSNSEMEVEEVKGRRGLKVDIPKNTLMVFRHTLTTSKKDRDGDILRTDGAVVDPKMLLLWQHVHTLPIGKVLGVDTHTKNKLVLISAIVDMESPLSHDAAVMVDNDMARFSHGFRALEFVEMKAGDGEAPGFDVKRFEIMEESMVSVPANIDATTEDVMLSLVEGGKLTSVLMKEYGKGIRDRMPLTISATAIGETDEDKSRDRKSETGESGQGESPGTSEKADEPTDEDKAEGTEDAEVMKDAEKLSEKIHEVYTQSVKDGILPEELKAGRSLSKANEAKLRDAKESVDAVIGMEIPRPAKAALREASSSLKDVLGAFGDDDDGKEVAKEISVKEAMSIVLAKATPEQLDTMLKTLQAFQGTDKSHQRGDEFRALSGTN